jgi:cell division protein ZapE
MTESPTRPDGPAAAYQARLAEGVLSDDPAQHQAIEQLETLRRALRAYRPPPPMGRRRAPGLLARLGLGKKPVIEPPRGLYLHGPVGRGKSMLMDLFFDTAPVEAKRRVHFHEFMLEIQARLAERRRQHGAEREPLGPLAAEVAAEAWLLCFDEFQVHDIADAMILGRLFEALLDQGVVVVATSNLAPDQLYEGGLNRDRVLPFIRLLEQRLDVIALAGATDYRMARLSREPVYHWPLGPSTDAALEQAFAILTDAAAGSVAELEVGSRRLAVPRAARGVAWFDFETLCEQPLGAADYLALTEHYHTVILAGVPQLTPDKRNEARRFVTLVDAFYDRRIKLVVGAAVAPAELYPAGEGTFEFRRTVSRLTEMQSSAYLAAPPLRGGAEFVPFALTTDLI